MSNEKRKLAAILFADIQGYTAIMQSDEELGFKMVEKFNDRVNNLVPKNEGEVIQFYGDGVLALFDSSARALECSIALQLEFRKDLEIPVRIGLNDGEVLLKDDNAFGDSINLASRIESIGIPGSVLFSESIYNHVQNKSQFDCQFIDKFHFKNIKREVGVYGLANEGLPIPDKSKVSGKLADKKSITPWKMGMASILFVALAVFITLKYFKTTIISDAPIHSKWIGNWNQQVEGTDKPLGGILQFIDSSGVLYGTAKNQYDSTSMVTTNNIFDLILSEDGDTINGKWQSNAWKDFGGDLQFIISENDREFVGFYTISEQVDSFFWNGSKN